MKLGQRVRIIEDGSTGVITEVLDSVNQFKVRLDDGDLVYVAMQAVTIIGMLDEIVMAIKSLIKSIGSLFKKRNA